MSRTPSRESSGLKAGGDAVERGHELGNAFEGEVLGLHGDEQGVGGDQGVEGEEVERGRAVEEDEGVVVAGGLEGFAEAVFAAFDADQLDVGADHVLGAGDEGEFGDLGGKDGFGGRGICRGGGRRRRARSSSRAKPRPPVVLAWGSTSRRRMGMPSRARAAARLMAVVVLPTPPFWLTMAMTLLRGVGPVSGWGSGAGSVLRSIRTWGDDPQPSRTGMGQCSTWNMRSSVPRGTSG